VNLFGARHVQMVGEGLLAVFVAENDTASVSHSLRAFKSAFALVKSASRVQAHLDQAFAGRKLPRFDIGIAVHSGPVTIAKLSDPLRFERTVVLPVGDTIRATMHLQQSMTHAGCAVIASETAVSGLENHLLPGRQASFDVHNNGQQVRVAEVLGLREGA
jgi:hypothetical protein